MNTRQKLESKPTASVIGKVRGLSTRERKNGLRACSCFVEILPNGIFPAPPEYEWHAVQRHEIFRGPEDVRQKTTLKLRGFRGRDDGFLVGKMLK